MARELTVSLNALRTHPKNIYMKLDVNSSRAAVRRGQELDLVSGCATPDAGEMAHLEEVTYSRFPRLGERRKQLAGTLSGGEQQMRARSCGPGTPADLEDDLLFVQLPAY